MAIIVSKKSSEGAQVITKSDFALERNLQDYICKHPEAISVDDNRLLVIARELQTQSGAIDAFAVDARGDLYIVETKLYRNPDKRIVLAQMLDYGASLWRHADFDQLLSTFDKAAAQNWKLPLRNKLAEFFSLAEESVDALVDAMARNLSDGKLKFVVLMDTLEDRLKDLITYVNENSEFDIYAVQVELYKYDDFEIVIPKLYGAEVKKEVTRGGRDRELWTWERFRERLNDLGDNSALAAEQILQWAEENGIKLDWTASQSGSCILCFYNSRGKGFYPFKLSGNGTIGWNAPHQEDKSPSPFDRVENRAEILRRLRAIPGVTVDLNNVDGFRGHNMPLSLFADEKARDEFFSVCSWINEALVKGQL